MNFSGIAEVLSVISPKSSRNKKQSPNKHALACTTFGTVSPSVIGSSVDDNTETCFEEAVGAVSWSKCRGCAFLLAAHETRCQVCGTASDSEEEVAGTKKSEHITSSAASVDLLGLYETTDRCSELSDVKCRSDSLEGGASESTTDGTDLGTESDMEDDLESTEGDGEYIPGTLDYAPPAGTQVRVLYDDDHWYLAEVLSGSKSVVRVSFSDGKRATIDLERHAVRLADYDEDDSSDEGSEEDAVECTADASINSASSPDMEAESDDEFEQIPGTLDEAPPVGTLVQILYDDNEWVVARIAAVDGKKALVVSGSDKEEDEVDFDEHAIRLHPVDTSGDSAETEQTQEQNGCAELCVQGDIVIESVKANVEEALDLVASAAVLTQSREEHTAGDTSQLPMVIGSPSD